MPDNNNKNIWDIIQIIFTILTTIVAGIWGFYIHSSQQESNRIQNKINEKQQEISNKLSVLEKTISAVEVMEPYFDKIIDPHPAKRKLAAYALYMLNKDDPEMVVNLIASASVPDRMELREVLEKSPTIPA